jgi:hypothetical protein
MTLPALPACTEPMVITPNFAESFSRLITLCTSTMKWAACITGSIVVCGREPWPPLPLKVICRPSDVELMTPGL